MGLEAECRAWYQGQPSIGQARLEPTELQFRGAFRLDIPLKAVDSAEAKGGQLRVAWPDGEAVLELGSAAEKWMLKIRYPRSRMEKLGVKGGMRVAILGIKDETFLPEISEQVTDLATRRPKKECDLLFAGIENVEDLDALPEWIEKIKPSGAIWTVFPKGQKHIKDSHVRQAGRAAGLVDVKVVAFSDTHSSLKWMRPKKS